MISYFELIDIYHFATTREIICGNSFNASFTFDATILNNAGEATYCKGAINVCVNPCNRSCKMSKVTYSTCTNYDLCMKYLPPIQLFFKVDLNETDFTDKGAYRYGRSPSFLTFVLIDQPNATYYFKGYYLKLSGQSCFLLANGVLKENVEGKSIYVNLFLDDVEPPIKFDLNYGFYYGAFLVHALLALVLTFVFYALIKVINSWRGRR